MSLTSDSEVRNVRGISEAERRQIEDFLQGAVYCWCKNRKDEWFALRDLMGGDNFDWSGTPLMTLYRKHKNQSVDPIRETAKDAGWLLKAVVAKDRRRFDTKKEAQTRQYRWTEDLGTD